MSVSVRPLTPLPPARSCNTGSITTPGTAAAYPAAGGAAYHTAATTLATAGVGPQSLRVSTGLKVCALVRASESARWYGPAPIHCHDGDAGCCAGAAACQRPCTDHRKVSDCRGRLRTQPFEVQGANMVWTFGRVSPSLQRRRVMSVVL